MESINTASCTETQKKEAENYVIQWNIHQNIGQFVKGLDRLPDAATVKKDTPKSAPIGLLDMVF